jgi:hypothetical protein
MKKMCDYPNGCKNCPERNDCETRDITKVVVSIVTGAGLAGLILFGWCAYKIFITFFG